MASVKKMASTSNESSQLDKMVEFITKEAEDKANMITSSSLEEASTEKNNRINAAKIRIDATHERRIKQLEVQRKIEYSNALNKNRLLVLKAREEALVKVFDETSKRLTSISDNMAVYKPLLKNLLIQTFFALMDTKVNVVCRAKDAALVKELIPEAVAAYEKEALGQKMEATVCTRNTLPEDSAGGVLAYTPGGKVRISNTLESRLELLQQDMLPEIRQMMFGPNPNRTHYD
ncbi:ATP synthase (E/31 kDa) subunit [Fonticula alba]|uniref:ATP synthase (E/31 kDa) subunit n=1 Tax=Fonticula alba TaxID=691883 RepID=A0A058Z1R5_FONAL|nr:ATP synthase (E/31 kDa) subunit [Fonticula alba]KCV67873.1 ATP synthase (E/31 kDa) subunit [Fonticula alba]|eukprot:XP_009497693.1 ATP synthase (E/31 kDa) subunit [Fonticula alba]